MLRTFINVLLFIIVFTANIFGQNIKGVVLSEDKEPLIGATVIVVETAQGAATDFDGLFEINHTGKFPILLRVSYLGFQTKEIPLEAPNKDLKITLEDNNVRIDDVVVKGQRVSEKQKAAPLTVESMDLLAIKGVASENFYDALGSMKGVDLTAASLGFKVINTRGFNSTSPVRSLQVIDGVDNQSPGLNFSLGNFLGSSELDIVKVDIIVGASSAFYGPNAFNGVISMETKNPFFHKGLSVQTKIGERSLTDNSIRWADSFKNKNGNEFIAYKLNFSYMEAYDWIADNYDPVYDTETGINNPGGYDAVNIYGDELYSALDFSGGSPWTYPGFGIAHRNGYRELDLVDYDTKNLKANVSVHWRTSPTKKEESPELILSSSYGNGTTVYQGDNRFSLRGIQFFQNRLEFTKRNKFFIRAYATHEDAGDSFDPYFTALKLQESAKDNNRWAQDYSFFWNRFVTPEAANLGYPQLVYDPQLQRFTFDYDAAELWLANNQDLLRSWHAQATESANLRNPLVPSSQDFFLPGTDRFNNEFNRITGLKSNPTEEGTRLYDKSALYHVHGEYKFEPTFTDEIIVGANSRLYKPESDGTIFRDTAGIKISNFEVGMYAGFKKKFFSDRFTLSGTVRADKNENFDWIATPAASLVYQPDPINFLRLSYSSAFRNPTLADQYLHLNVGRAILAGNLEGWNNLLTVESFTDYLGSLDKSDLDSFNIRPIQPERVKTVEVGYRTTLFNKIYVDAGYYFSIYDDFLGYNIGVVVDEFDEQTGIPSGIQPYRVAANSLNRVTTQGLSLGLNYYFGGNYMIAGNYSWNKLNKVLEDDPIIPAFNTPEHKYNIGISGRNIAFRFLGINFKNVGFNVNYKWIEGFLFEGSPQFTGFIPSYDLVDGQLNYTFDKLNTTLKIGASNLLNNKQFQAYGGPRIGRLAYISLLYEFRKK